MFRSPRYLVFRHAQRAIRKKDLGEELDEDLQPGQEHLRSFFVPGLQAGWHTIKVSQPVSTTKESETLSTTQRFNVQEPRFVLPDDAINTCYPPQGFTTTAETLPHVIFNNPTFPWERVGSRNADKKPNPPDYSRNRTPWLAVFVFTDDELKLAEGDLKGSTSLFRNIPSLKNGAKQDATFTVTVPANELSKIESTVTPYTNDVDSDRTPASTILLERELFVGLFSQYDGKGVPQNTSYPYVYHHRYLAHKRVINTEGMALAGAENADDTGSFGVIVSHRSGPPSITVPTPVYVHLVSIEGVEQMAGFPFTAATRFVALVSLASWSYTCLPPETPNVHDKMVALGKSLSLLSSSITNEMRTELNQNTPVGPRLVKRLDQGYALSRYRTQSGEVTSCFLRGPFTSVDPYAVPDYFPKTSMLGTDLSILDRDLGLMDISYASAWQLGRAMAISDQAFTTSLYRVRTQIIQRATEQTRSRYLMRHTHHKDKERLLAGMKDSVEKLSLLPKSNGLMRNDSLRRRWERKIEEPLDLTYHGPIVDAFVDPNYIQAAKDVASTPDPEDPSKPSNKPYDEFNAPFSADWVMVLRWVLDRLFFDSIPAHYLLPDASFLPQESLKVFTIDDNWTNCFLDGALSLGNHIDQESDKVRDAIKFAINWYLESHTSIHDYPPPMPKYGCFIRSTLISQFPDLIVKVEPEPAPKPDVPPVLLAHEILDKGTMLCLFSQPPSASTFQRLTLTQPPHQQSFVVGEKVTTKEVTVAYRRAYTVKDPSDPEYDRPFKQDPWKKGVVPADRPVMYLWDFVDPVTQGTVNLNVLLMDNYSPDYNNQLNQLMPAGFYSDDQASSALMAWQLNNPSYLLPIEFAGQSKPQLPHRPRTLPVYRRVPPAPPAPPSKSHTEYSKPSEFISHESRKVRKHYVPLASRNPMGRYTRQDTSIPKRIRDPAKEQPELPDPGIDNWPDFEFFFWSMEQPGTPNNPGSIPMLQDVNGDPMPQDIIFSINCIDNAIDAFAIEYIQINIKQGPPPTNTKPSKGPLTTVYDGPGGSMLSNLRFNPINSFSDTYDTLIIRLIPRSTDHIVTADRCVSMSFLLAGVKVNVSPAQVTVEPTITIHYRNRPVQTPTQFPSPAMTLKPVPIYGSLEAVDDGGRRQEKDSARDRFRKLEIRKR